MKIRKQNQNTHEQEQQFEDKIFVTICIEDNKHALRGSQFILSKVLRYLKLKSSLLLRIQQVLQKKQLKHYDS